MVILTDEQIAQYKRDGFLIVSNFLNPEETRAAQEGFYRHFAPHWQDRERLLQQKWGGARGVGSIKVPG